MALEEEISNITTCLFNRVTWLKDSTYREYSPEQQVTNMLAYLEGGINKGYSSFYTYQKTYDIYKLVKDDIVVALTSADPFIRLLAVTIQKENVDISTPYKR